MTPARNVVLIDAGGTNIGSVRYALERLGVVATMSDDPERIRAASHVILPGVGAAGPGMARLRERGLDSIIGTLTQPVLGVCLGMQLMFEYSEEGDVDCLGVVPGAVRHFPRDRKLRVPHMGWNTLLPQRDDPLIEGVLPGDFAYFVHSYAAPAGPEAICTCEYGMPFAAVVRRDNFCGMQFHPERSARVGARLLENFLRL